MSAKSSRRSGLTIIAATIALAACGVHTSSSGGIKITSIAPPTGTLSGGPQITISGTGFDDHSGHADVSFGQGTVVGDVISDTTIHVPLPGSLACGKVDVQVANGHGDGFLSNGFNYTGGTGTLTIASISPSTGSLAGGDTITITGSGFTGGVGLSIGGQLLTNVVIVDDQHVTAVTPPRTAGGQTDLIARNCSHQAQMPGAFVYKTDLNGGVAIFEEFHYPDPAQFGNSPVDFVDPFAAFYQPTTEPMLLAIPTAGTCVLLTTPTYLNLTELDAGASVTYASGGISLVVAEQTTATGTFFEYYDSSTDTNLSSYLPGGMYSFEAAGSAAMPAFTTTAAFIASAVKYGAATTMFDSATTTELYTGTATTNPSTVTKANGMQLTWTAPTPADQANQQLYIQVDGFDASANYTNSVACTATDNGSFKVPATALNLLTNTTAQALVTTDRRKVMTFLNRGNGTTMTALTIYEQVGRVLLN